MPTATKIIKHSNLDVTRTAGDKDRTRPIERTGDLDRKPNQDLNEEEVKEIERIYSTYF